MTAISKHFPLIFTSILGFRKNDFYLYFLRIRTIRPYKVVGTAYCKGWLARLEEDRPSFTYDQSVVLHVVSPFS